MWLRKRKCHAGRHVGAKKHGDLGVLGWILGKVSAFFLSCEDVLLCDSFTFFILELPW